VSFDWTAFFVAASFAAIFMLSWWAKKSGPPPGDH
jgi:hypothetical protein